MTDIRLQHLIEQLEAEVTSLAGSGTHCVLIDQFRYKTEIRDGQIAHLTGLISADRKVLIEGDLIQINGEGPLLILVYGSYNDPSANFNGIGWHFQYLDGEYKGFHHSSPAEWYIEGIAVRGHTVPIHPVGAAPLTIVNGRYELAPGLLEGTRVTWQHSYAVKNREGVLCFGRYDGTGYGSRETRGIVWNVKFDDGHHEAVEYPQDITPDVH